VDAIVAAANATGCDCLHPGYGFLSESSALAAACAAAGVVFIGPEPATLDMLGDKTAARALAQDLGVPVLAGTGAATAE
ncbi:MAG: acetyl/propionyl-CoA carboxylase subunit alpha, partial [Gammaproteobacteria bacterium]|nr:acetyl/propionyl-CoA carboxylase subunit alpha [Gammaproteobacteria bacterium]